jgi:hypothetical protein
MMHAMAKHINLRNITNILLQFGSHQIELNAHCEKHHYMQAVNILENHFPHNGFISEFKEKMAV